MGLTGLLMNNGCGVLDGTKRLNRFCTVPLEPLACTRKALSLRLVGVPEMAPVVELSDNPFGRTPLGLNQVQPVPHPGATSVCEYGMPIVPCGRTPPVVMANGSTLMV